MEALDCPRARVEDGKTPDMLHATDSRGGACEKHIYLFLWLMEQTHSGFVCNDFDQQIQKGGKIHAKDKLQSLGTMSRLWSLKCQTQEN